MTTTYTLDGFRTNSRQFYDAQGNFTGSDTLSTTPVTLSITLADTITGFTYAFDPNAVDNYFPAVTLSISPTLFFDGQRDSALHPTLTSETQIGQFSWSGGTTRLLNIYYDDFTVPTEFVFDYTFFLDGPVPNVASQQELALFLADEASVDLESLSEAERDALIRQTFGPGTDDFAPGAEISLAALNWDSIVDNPGNPTEIGLSLIGDGDPNQLDGEDGDDTLDGGRGNDTLDGAAGADDMRGGVGDDDIDGGADDDVIRGGKGEDTIEGGEGDDVIRGQSNGDILSGGNGADNIKGGGGNDFLDGGDGNDFLKGGSRKDTINGGDGDDKLFGNSFDDVLNGDDGDDVLNAGGENDILDGGGGNDTLKGGAGADTFIFSSDTDQDLVLDYELGIDSIRVDSALLAEGILTGAAVEATYGGVVNGVAVLDFGEGHVVTFRGLSTEVGLGDDITVI